MSSSPEYIQDEPLGESWVDLSLPPSDRFAPLPLADVRKLLLEAQEESTRSGNSSKGSSRQSPKSPPNSPSEEMLRGEDRTNVYINCNRGDIDFRNTDWIWDWSSRPDNLPPKHWKFEHPSKSRLSMRHSKVIKSGLLSTEVLSIMLITNLVSVLLGAGLGFFLGKRMALTYALD